MGTTCWLVSNKYYFAILEYTYSCSTTTYVYNSALGYTKYCSCSCRFVYNGRHFKIGSFYYIGDNFYITIHNSRRNRCSCCT